MTPLAKQILKAAFEPAPSAERLSPESADFAARLLDAHCFDVTEIVNLSEEFIKEHFPQHVDQRLMFLPSAHTWLEAAMTVDGSASRSAISLIDQGNGFTVGRMFSRLSGRRWPPMIGPIEFRLGQPSFEMSVKHWRGDREILHEFLQIFAAGLLTLVNQPSGICRESETPHRGFERRLRNVGALTTGKLRPWTKLKITPPVGLKVADEGETAAHPSGYRKCYHFVRAHFRAANGQFVRPHFRGDPALGIGRKSYQVQV